MLTGCGLRDRRPSSDQVARLSECDDSSTAVPVLFMNGTVRQQNGDIEMAEEIWSFFERN